MPEATPAQSWTFDGVVRLTRIGSTYVLFTVVIGFAALNTGNNALYIALTFLLASLLLSGIASRGGLKHLRVELASVDQPWAGSPAAAILRITNDSPVWNVRDVVVVSDELNPPVVIDVIRRRSTVSLNASFLFARRGIVELKRVDLYTRYPFGFFLKKRRVRMQSEIVVFPRLQLDSATLERFRPVAGEQTSTSRPGAGTEVHSFREYVHGDSLRQVYWKKSAAIGRWIIKQTEAEAARAVHVVIDPYKAHGSTDDDVETMISDAATFIHHSLRRQLEVVVTMPKLTLRAGEFDHSAAIFRALATLEPIHERLEFTLDRNTILFTVRSRDASAA
jgi:uncharacterized protein (DUF58 family)